MIFGTTEPRLCTPPLRELTPVTSYGFEVMDFARDVVTRPLDPWQEWLAIHAGELLPDGRPRFRIVLVLVARQNGKTELLVILCLFWQFVEFVPLILGTSTKLDYAKESWRKSVKLAQRSPALTQYREPNWKREANGEQESWTLHDSRYKIAASNEEGGRSLTIDKLVADELRQHHDYSAWEACEPACSRWDSQIWALSNAGDDRSIVLNDHRDSALEFIEWWDANGDSGVAELLLAGQVPPNMPGDHRLGIFEWSAEETADPLDITALAQANPNLGRRRDPEDLLSKARRAVAKGGEALTKFKTENMCIRVKILSPAIDPGAWRRCLDPGDLAAVRNRVALCLDVAPDEQHATLAAAAVLPDGRVRVEIVAAWAGAVVGSDEMWNEVDGLVARVRAAVRGWYPNGPAAALAARLRGRRKPGQPVPVGGWEEIRGEVSAVCMGFAEQVKSGKIAHSDDPLMNEHVESVEWLQRGDTRVFSRKGGHSDAAYAAAGATHLARTLPPPLSMTMPTPLA